MSYVKKIVTIAFSILFPYLCNARQKDIRLRSMKQSTSGDLFALFYWLWSFLILKIMEEEIWRPVKGYEGIYEVSDMGRVRSLDRVITTPERIIVVPEKKTIMPGKIKQLSNETRPHCTLSKDGDTKVRSVLMLMAEVFPEMNIETKGRKKPERVSAYRGVYWSKKRHKWQAIIKTPGCQRSLGFFDMEIEASERWEEVNAEWIRCGLY